MSALSFPSGVRPRDEAFGLYWHFAAERHAILERRLQQSPAPWTDDPILSHYKFCNVFRVTDRVTQDLLRSAQYSLVAQSLTPEDRVLRTIIYRFFSEPDTWACLDDAFGPLTVGSFDEVKFRTVLDKRMDSGRCLYTGAFILCANSAFGYSRKHHNHAALFSTLAANDGAALRDMLAAPDLESLYGRLRDLPLVGKFMAYQIAIDINYGPDIDFSESSFVAAGPGAERGILKCFEHQGAESPESLIQWIVANQEELAAHYGHEAPTLYGRRLQSIDCQGLFCETDKYCRVALPELKSQRSRIKSTFRPQGTPQRIFVPPKWNLKTEERAPERSDQLTFLEISA